MISFFFTFRVQYFVFNVLFDKSAWTTVLEIIHKISRECYLPRLFTVEIAFCDTNVT